jgi:hypothetical protein
MTGLSAFEYCRFAVCFHCFGFRVSDFEFAAYTSLSVVMMTSITLMPMNGITTPPNP